MGRPGFRLDEATLEQLSAATSGKVFIVGDPGSETNWIRRSIRLLLS
jgi:hypothetical protein